MASAGGQPGWRVWANTLDGVVTCHVIMGWDVDVDMGIDH